MSTTIYKADLHVADMDRQYYQQHSLTLAQHPSETAERLMLRLLVFACHASDTLTFTKGLSSEDEPDLWQKTLTGDIDTWIDLGLPSEKRIRKACGRAEKVFIYTYGRGSAESWWKSMQSEVARFHHLSILHIPPDITQALGAYAQRQIEVSVNIQDAEVSWHCLGESLVFTPEVLFVGK
jgi:uncharacterized protein YaeQ